LNVKVSELRAIADRLFAYLEETERGEFEIPEDYYWEISKEDLYDPAKDPNPKDFGVGQLSHDWERLNAILAGDDPPIGYALVWLSAVLRAIGEKTVY
jgi:hypothetical protein